jgi:putative inorganic carbon (hco3(-)) transporter
VPIDVDASITTPANGEARSLRLVRSARRLLLGALLIGFAVSITLSELALVGLAMLLVAEAWHRRTAPRPWPLLTPILTFAAATLLSAAVSNEPWESLMTSKELLGLATLYVVGFTLPDATTARRAGALFFGLMAVVGLLGVLQIAFCPPAPPALPVLGRFFRKCHRAHGFFSIYMTLAGVITLALLAAAPSVTARGPRRAVALMAWLGGVAGLVATYTRGAWVGFVAGLAVASIFMRWRGVVVVGAAALTLGVAVAAVPSVRARVANVVNPHDETARDRMAMLRTGFLMVRERPLFGVGPGQVERLYPVYVVPEALRRSTSHLHNTPLQILVERGIVGLATWVAIFATFFVQATAIWRRLGPARTDDRALVGGSIAAVAGFLVAGLFEDNFGDTEVLLVACAVMALPYVVERDLAATPAVSIRADVPVPGPE